MIQATAEQEVAIEKFRSGQPLKIIAFAGTGKTSTLTMLARTRRARGLYLAFNKAIANEAAGKFPATVGCRTTHAIAFASVARDFQSGSKLTGTLHPKQLSELEGLQPRRFSARLQLQGVQQAHLILETIRHFCQSTSPAIDATHLPRYGRLLEADPATIASVRSWTVAAASKIWQRMISTSDDLPMGHDGYLKLWTLSKPKLAAEYILLDEAQDTNHAVLAVLQAQTSQMVYVGDRHQQIYEWRGAVNAMEQVTGCNEAYLTQSFRFGATIADAASQVIATLGEKHQLRGNPDVHSAIANSRATRAVLSRTNASVMMEVLDALQAGRRPHIVGGTWDQTRLLGDVAELQKGRPGTSPEFFGFTDWHDVVQFGKSEEGKSVAMIVDLVQQHGASKLWTAVKQVVSEERNADVILSTVHKAKGREWDSVRLTPDFADSAQAAALRASSEEVRLFYVAITRARKLLSVEPAMLTHFTSGAWQTPRAPAATSPSAPHLPPSEPSKRAPPRNYVAPGAIPRPPPRR